jgi:hypothetical protein
MMKIRIPHRSSLAMMLVLATPTIGFADELDDIGFRSLQERLGASAPSGAGVVLGQVEVPNPGYGPNQSNPEFAGVTFVEQSGAAGTSGHATTVATRYFGQTLSPAPGVTTVHLWDVNQFLFSGYLKQGTASPPVSPPTGLRVFNHSWIGSLGNAGSDKELLRRADYAANAFRTMWVVGVNNGASSANEPLLSGMFHGLSVGLSSGNHGHDDTGPNTDAPGRQKPEIVAPGDFTSFATPLVGGCAALLYETRESTPELASNGFADLPQVIKAVLMAGAVRNESWTNLPTPEVQRGVTDRPLDEVFGAGVVNVDRAHRIFTGLERDGGASVPATSTLSAPSWDYETMSGSETYWHRIDLAEAATEVSVCAAWNRITPTNWASTTLPDIDVEVFSIDAAGGLVPLAGAGPEVFGGGNVRSESGLDLAELIHVRDLAAGSYAIRFRRVDDSPVTTRMAIAAWLPVAGEEAIPGDLNGDGRVDGSDFGLLLVLWGTSDPDADLDGNGIVSGSDMGVMLANWTG